MMAAIGRQLKQSVKVFQSLMLYLLLPVIVQTNQRERIEQLRHGNSCVDKPSKDILTFIVESVNPVDRSTLMVASQEKKVLRILDFVG